MLLTYILSDLHILFLRFWHPLIMSSEYCFLITDVQISVVGKFPDSIIVSFVSSTSCTFFHTVESLSSKQLVCCLAAM